MTISVVIPTYGRPRELERCLEALQNQTRPPDRAIIITHNSDLETRLFLERKNSNTVPISAISLKRAGQVAALNAGIGNAREEIISFTDDDAVPRPDWLERIEADFRKDPRIGGVGGRDITYVNDRPLTGSEKVVGRILWFGRIIGNHHLGAGPAREADHLKGANMSFRRDAVRRLRFDEFLRGKAEYRNDLAFSLAVKNRGWKLIYDPEIVVDHYRAARIEDFKRGEISPQTIEREAFNEMLVILKYFPNAKKVFAVPWDFLCENGGLFRMFARLRNPRHDHKKFRLAMRSSAKGRLEAIKTYLRHKND